MQAASPNSTELSDRTLWYDGDSTVSEEYISEALRTGWPLNGLFVEKLTNDIRQYNSVVPRGEEITVKTDVRTPNLEFTIPEEYLTLDIEDYVATKLTLEFKKGKLVHAERIERIDRIGNEMRLYENLGLFNVLRTLIFVINTLQDKNVVWGVGRGSCVASYVLYLIGVHDVDSVEYDLDIKEFLRT